MKFSFLCPMCMCETQKERSAYNRAQRSGLAFYCGRKCAGAARRNNKDRDAKIAEKAEYDRLYRLKNREVLRAKKAVYYAKNHDREKEREIRKLRMPKHVEYCRRPEYKAYKKSYDRKYRAERLYGDFSESYLFLLEIENEVSDRATRTEIYTSNGILNKALKRKRDYVNATGIPYRNHPKERALGDA